MALQRRQSSRIQTNEPFRLQNIASLYKKRFKNRYAPFKAAGMSNLKSSGEEAKKPLCVLSDNANPRQRRDPGKLDGVTKRVSCKRAEEVARKRVNGGFPSLIEPRSEQKQIIMIETGCHLLQIAH